MALSVSGLASGVDWKSIVEQLAEVERAPQTRLRTEQSLIQQRNNAFGSIKTQLSVLQNRIKALKEGSLFDSRTVNVSNSSVATATTSGGTPLGTFQFSVSQMAKAATLNGQGDIGNRLSATSDVSALQLSDAAFRTAVTAGTFTVNGKQITVEATDTLQGVFSKISTATGGSVTASYNPTTDHIQLSGSGEVILGSATDTSNFLDVARLSNNGTASIESSSMLGSVRISKELSAANLATSLNATGGFKINGVSFTYDASVDSLSNVLSRINNSTAGVSATYDTVNDRVVLTNKTTGDVGVAVEDVSGNFAAATGLTTGSSLQRGKNLIYTVNGGGTLTSQSNTISAANSGISGLNVSVLAEGSFSIGVTVDTTTIKNAIKGLVEEYNKTQALINTNTASSTDSKGKVTGGVLAADPNANALNSDLRRLVNGDIAGLSGSVQRFASLGYSSNGNDDSLILSSESSLDQLLSSDLTSLKEFFTNSTSGLAVSFDKFIDKTIGDGGTLVVRQTNLTDQSKKIDESIAALERVVQTNKERLTSSFIAMETAQSNINQQLTYLQRSFPA